MVLDVGQICDLKPTIGTIPRSYQNHIKIVAKPHQKRIKTISKSYQNHKNHRKSSKNLSLGCFWFLFLKPTHRNHIQNRIKTTKTREKSSKKHQKTVPGLFLFLFLKPTHWNQHGNAFTHRSLYTQTLRINVYTPTFSHTCSKI